MSWTYIADHGDRAVEKLLSQFRDKPRFGALLRALAYGAQQIESDLDDLITARTLTTATDDALDQYGAAVGEARGGLADADYRKFIAARILANRCDGSIDALAGVLGLLFGVTVSTAIEHSEAYPLTTIYTVEVFSLVDDVIASRIARTIREAKPAGVFVEVVEALDSSRAFRFDTVGQGLDVGKFARTERGAVTPTIVQFYAPWAYFDASNVVESGGTISSVPDLSGNGHDADQISGAAPTIEASAAEFGGMPAMVFGGSGFMYTTDTFAAGDFTVLIAWVDTGSTVVEESPLDSNYVTSFWIGRNSSNVDTWTFGIRESSAPYGEQVTATDGDPHVFALRRSGTDGTIIVDGAAQWTGTVDGTALAANSIKFGGGTSGGEITGKVAVVLIFDYALSDTDLYNLGLSVWRDALGQTGGYPPA